MSTVVAALLHFFFFWALGPIPASHWTPGPVLDQGSQPACVGYAFASWLQARPGPLAQLDGAGLYQQAKRIDGVPTTAGTYPWAVAAVVARLGYINRITYTSVVTAALISLATGPIIVNASWYTGMSNPINGVAKPTGATYSYHEFMCYSYRPDTRMVGCENSWGRYWGVGGFFAISSDDLQAVVYGAGFAIPTKAGGNRTWTSFLQ